MTTVLREGLVKPFLHCYFLCSEYESITDGLWREDRLLKFCKVFIVSVFTAAGSPRKTLSQCSSAASGWRESSW